MLPTSADLQEVMSMICIPQLMSRITKLAGRSLYRGLIKKNENRKAHRIKKDNKYRGAVQHFPILENISKNRRGELSSGTKDIEIGEPGKKTDLNMKHNRHSMQLSILKSKL